ncbi:deoxycytidyl transferase [Dipsacomyces acuminosporus]|nr:deoxycytidyl transferase [Dipsacomyces acuminosporus]
MNHIGDVDNENSSDERKEYQLDLADVVNLRSFQNAEGEDEEQQLVLLNKESAQQTVVPGFGEFRAYSSERKRKLAEQAEQSANKTHCFDAIFRGVTFHINGYTQPSHYELKRMLLNRGGKFLHYISKTQVTHIIASSLTMAKEKEFSSYRVVRPEWVVDSIRAGKQLSWHRYKLVGRGNKGVLVDASQGYLDAESLNHTQPQQLPPLPPLPSSTQPKARLIVDRFGEGLNRDWVRKNLATDKDFISRYYANSRLHHLSVWKADMKDYVAELRQKYKQSIAKEGPVSKHRIIMHVDFDCFFVSASLLSHPYLKDRPVAVCHSQQQMGEDLVDPDNLASDNTLSRPGGTSQIASCNYIARSFGVKNGMFMDSARKLCPSLMTVPYCFDDYKRISRTFYETVTQIADETQAVSIDEALLDVTGVVSRGYAGSPEQLAEHIRRVILERTQCTVSIGIGPSILLARVATTKAKPDGVYALDVDRFLALDMKLTDLPGIGYMIENSFSDRGIKTVADIRSASLQQLQSICGEKVGSKIYSLSRGIDDRVLESDRPRQAFGADIGWGVRFSDQDEADDFIRRLSAEVCRSMSASKRTGRSVTLKIKQRRDGQGRPGKFLGHGICDSLSKSKMLSRLTDDPVKIASACIDLLRQMSVDPLDIRSVGIQIQKLNDVHAGADIASIMSKPKAQDRATHSKGNRGLASELPSASQLDINVISELPLSIQQELQAAYQQLDPKINIGISSHSPESTATAKKPARKPSHGAGHSGRGRPRKLLFPTSGTGSKAKAGGRTLNLVQAFRKAESLDAVMPSQIDGSVWESLPADIRREVARDYLRSKPSTDGEEPQASNKLENAAGALPSASNQEDPQNTEDKDQDGHQKQPVPALLGKSEIADIRRLIKAWVASSETGPYEEDVGEIASFAVSLVRCRDLLKAQCTLACLRHCVEGRGSAWTDAFADILSHVNDACLDMYSACISI